MVAGKQKTLAAAVFAFFAMATAASAQVTGTVTGTVKDPQGGVIPGAAVTLTSDTRGTKLPDVFTNEAGNFTVVNVPPDKYTIQINMQGFKPAKQSGVSVSPGDRQEVGVFTIEIGGLTDSVVVKAETPMVQARSGERSFTIPTSSVENLPIANRSFTALASLAPRRHDVERPADRRSHSHRRRRRHQHHDGRRRRHGHGQQPPAPPDEHSSRSPRSRC